MVRYAVELSEGASIEFDVSASAPALSGLLLEWSARTETELRDMVQMLGGVEQLDLRSGYHSGLLYRRAVPVTRDGERVASACVLIRLGGDLRRGMMVYPVVAALERERAWPEVDVDIADGIEVPQ